MDERVTALGGALERRARDVWVWTDTWERELRVRDLRVIDLAPNYRVTTLADGSGFVEVPKRWRKDVTDPDVEEAIIRLLALHGEPAAIYAEGPAEMLRYHRVSTRGWRVPLEEWDREMGRVIGARWDKADEPALLERAARARGERQEQRG